MIRTSLTALALAAVLAPALAQAADMTPEQFIQRHMDFAAKGDAAAIANDFAVDGASINGANAAVGRDAIQAQFAKLVGPRPGGGGGGMGSMKVDKIWSDKNVGFIQWEAGPVHATEVFVINKDDKIQSQSVFMSGAPGGPPPGAPK